MCYSSPDDDSDKFIVDYGDQDDEDGYDYDNNNYYSNDLIIPFIELTNLKDKALSSDEWNFTSLQETATVFPISLTVTTQTLHTYDLSFGCRFNGFMETELSYTSVFNEFCQHCAEYKGTFSLMGLLIMSEKSWDKAVTWSGNHVEELALSSCKQVQQNITDRGDTFSWIASFDGFYFNLRSLLKQQLGNSSSSKIIWFAHQGL